MGVRQAGRFPVTGWIAGVDEAGRGPLAGPVVVAAVILDPAHPIEGLADSKQLSATRREQLFTLIVAHTLAHAIVRVEAAEIDRVNILQATLAGMRRALEALAITPAQALIDGNRLPKALPCPARAIVRGDATEPAISAASILAKVARDRILCEYDARWPGYGFAQHKGYPVPGHLEALRRLGPCPEHRRSFAPVRKVCLCFG
ncbi:MAG TPA: ribonuclease HII [Rhodanobacteraceae bacterium]|nr:ribonuclease HII [Rhodanobacteraceae bacterium]